MKIAGRLTLGACVVVVALAAVAAKTRTADKDHRHGSRDDSASARDAAAVAKVITGSTKALSDFPRTRSAESVRTFYSKDYTGIENGEESSLEDQRKLLSDLLERIDQGVSVGISSTARNIRVRIVGQVAWATYDYDFRIAAEDGNWDEEEGKCTSVLEKTGASWLFTHEHCSSACPDEDPGDEDERPTQDKT